ncbi:PREDICTED: transmembrane and coiled-coil domain-containing protein 4-like isoform X2 [Nelumbo nucifera]|uniref:Transmembrane and coiled-coil domain-containing protein 4-like n=2 Tax=Nelumbo nucifera TaxID=4432 RepID=A0A822Z9J6_NELNU|nr:PREDICTED: transmembrane and coiled-coil domain-containing protein 4-like isoform X2 [Nelumbo nucifera]DAD40411.1 TPA_asm: hypothetical protein HUJ06_014734 [Nelumbo nucifera]
MATSSRLTPKQRYAAGALLALALHQAQIHQARLFILPDEETTNGRTNNGRGSDSPSEEPQLWIHENSGLLRPVFRSLEIDCEDWPRLEETARFSPAKDHVGALLRLLSKENGETSSERLDQELALTKAVDAMEMKMQTKIVSSEGKREVKHLEYEQKCQERISTETSEAPDVPTETSQHTSSYTLSNKEDASDKSTKGFEEKPIEEETLLSYERKVAFLYELLSACLAGTPEDDKKDTQLRKGYDARHRVALHLLATWLNFKWIKMEAMEVMVALSAITLMKNKEEMEETKSPENSWDRWKRGGIIGAAALTGGTLLAITGGLAAPAIAAGFGALAPTLGTLVPVIGASGFAAAASAAGSVAGSVAVAASFGVAGAGLSGMKMARRIGDVDEFEFKAIGPNHNQGRLAISILISGIAFEEEDFIRPWEGLEDNLERYVLQWESENLIAVSKAIQDWLTSKITSELMKRGAMMTVLSSLVTALAWPTALLAATDYIDSKWTIAVDRSDKAGKLLAEVLVKGLQGNRPVTLIAFSLGARIVFKCLQCLAEIEDNGAGIVERVVLLGAPISIRDENWDTVRRMVAGRFVNAYSTNDWTLGIAFRASLLSEGLAGIQPVEVQGIENVDVTELIEGHSSYLWTTQEILERLELDTYYPIFRSSDKSDEEKNEKI